MPAPSLLEPNMAFLAPPLCIRSVRPRSHLHSHAAGLVPQTFGRARSSPSDRVRMGAETATNASQFPPISVSLTNLGCAKNTTDAEVFLGDLARNGIKVVDENEPSDVSIVNTCAFIDDAKNESIDAILNLAQGGERKVLVTGCLAQRYSKELADSIPEASAFVGFEHYGDIVSKVRALAGAQETSRVQVGTATVPFRPEYDRVRLTPRHYAYVRVAEGCDHRCAFCRIPFFRGQFRSKPWESLVHEIDRLAATGVKELNLIAEDTNQYGTDFKGESQPRLEHLLRHIDTNVPSIAWVRLLYCYPSYFSDSLIDAIGSCSNVVPYIDIPLQHISERVLKAMNRPPKKHTLALLDRLRERIPSLALRTTFITGFPGETEEDHRELVNFVKESRFVRAGIFAYSAEDGTPAADFEAQVDDDTKQRRLDELVSTQQQVQEELALQKVGTVQSVLIDKNEDGHSIGRCCFDAPDIDGQVHVLEQIEPGSLIQVRILGTNSFDLFGEPLSPQPQP